MPKVSTAYYSDYSGGLNDTSAPTEIAQNEATLLQNWDITYQAQLIRRDGLTLVGAHIDSSPITGGAAYLRTAGQDVLVTSSTNLWYLNSGTWTKLANNLTNTAGLKFNFVNVQSLNKIYFGNEDNVLSSWDRAGTTLNTAITQLASSIPHGNIYKWYRNFLFTLNNVNISGTKYANRLYWSNIGDPTTWDTTNNFFDIPGDGRAITMIPMQSQLVIFKERSIQILDGYGNSSWQVSGSNTSVANFSEQIGTLSPYGVCSVGNDIWFIDSEGNIRRLAFTDYNTFRRDIVSTKIQGTLGSVNKSQLAQAVAWTNNNKVYFSVPTGSNTTNNLVMVFDLIASRRISQSIMIPEECWTTYTGWAPSIMWDYPTSTIPDLYIGDATTGNVYKKAGNDDNGTVISARWDGKADYYGNPLQFKRFRFGHARANSVSGSDTSIGFYSSIDGGSFANIGNLSLTASGTKLGPTGPARMGPSGTFQLGGSTTNELYFDMANGGNNAQGKSNQMSIRHADAGATASVNTFAIYYKNKDIR